MTLRLESSAFAGNAAVPKDYAQEGDNKSPPLRWSGAPEGIKSFVLEQLGQIQSIDRWLTAINARPAVVRGLKVPQV